VMDKTLSEDARIDHLGHALFTMVWCATIDPFWVRVLDGNGEGCPRGVILGLGRDESRIEASFNGVARLVKLGLHHCVFLPRCQQKCPVT
jgi:hypothetical protein